MKRFNLFIAMAGAALMAMAQQQGVSSYDFSIRYHWGLIDEIAGSGSLTLSLDGDQYSAYMRGHSIPWFGRVYAVSDTLVATVSPQAETVQYINGWYTKPRVHNVANMDNPNDYKNIYGQGALNADAATIEAVTITADMLGVFYYTQVLDFDSMEPGQQTVIPITRPDGSQQSLTITYNGKGNCHCSCDTPTYDIVFNYTYQGAPCQYDVYCQVARDTGIPTLISADIAIGHVEMVLQ